MVSLFGGELHCCHHLGLFSENIYLPTPFALFILSCPIFVRTRYIVSQECLAGFDGGSIFIAPPVATTASSGFPQPVNMGSTWDGPLVREIASAISDEARAAFNHAGRPSLTCMSPNLNVARDPRWGRSLESFGEDPDLIAMLGKAYVDGIQRGRLETDAAAAASGYLKIMAIPKHIGAYSVECFNASGGPNEYPRCSLITLSLSRDRVFSYAKLCQLSTTL